MKALAVKDRLNRTNFQKSVIEKKYLKAVKSNYKFNLNLNSKMALSKFIPKKVKNRCIFSGRSRSLLGDFKISRLEFSKKAKYYNLPGLEKASW